MTPLVTCAGILALLSGLGKLFGKGRTPGALPLLPLLEVLAGIGGPFYTLTRPSSPLMGATIASLLVVLVLYSSVTRVRRLRARQRRREASEEARLTTYVKHFSKVSEDGEIDPPPSPIRPSQPPTHSPPKDR